MNVSDLEAFEAGTVVDTALLRQAGLVKGSPMPIKVLGRGELTKKLTVKADAFSASAKTKIEAAGGSCECLGG